MRGEAMKHICERLKQQKINLAELTALEFFAREGDWQTKEYASFVKMLDAWEISPEFEQGLRTNLPFAKITIGDSFKLAKLPEHQNKYSFIVFDNPQGIYGLNNEYCEHFEALPLVPHMMSEKAFVIFNVNRAPYDYHKFPEWQLRRKLFYKTEAANLSSEALLNFYTNFFKQLNLVVLDSFEMPRNSEYLSYLVFYLSKA